ncbi:MAG: prefoldin subunit alpha [Candidatus Methanomethylophilaceae archaeon]|nr:prefoldin subunit alpha [Candidatus Methanomethylophilaceae archaeon]
MQDNELRQSMALLEAYNSQLEALAKQSQLLQMSLSEIVRAREALRALQETEEGEEVLVPVGASIFVSAKASAKRSAIVSIGSRVSMEMNLDAALDYIKRNSDEISEALGKISETVKSLEATAQNLAVTVQEEMTRRGQ